MSAALARVLPAREWAAVDAWASTFYDFQRRWLFDPSRFAYLVKARQVGASHTYAGAAILWGLVGEPTTIVSRADDDACDVLDKCGRHAEVLARLGSRWAKPVATSKHSLRLASGGRIVVKSSTSGGRGTSGNAIVDEFAYHLHPEQVWDAVGAVVTHGFRLRVLSTPNGVGNLFWQLCTDPARNRGYQRHAVTIDQAAADGLVVPEDVRWKMARGDPRLYDQLFRCSFLDAEEQYLPTSLIQAASVADTSLRQGAVYAGMDVGLTNDLTSLVILRVDGDGRRWVQQVLTCKRTSFEEQEQLVAKSFHAWQWHRLCLDASGLGKGLAERLVRQYGGVVIDGKPQGGRVEPVDFTLRSKEELATGLYAAFAKDRVRIPSGDAGLRNDLCAIRRIVTAAGNVRYDAPRTEAGHADRAWALALALHACSRPITYRSIVDAP